MIYDQDIFPYSPLNNTLIAATNRAQKDWQITECIKVTVLRFTPVSAGISKGDRDCQKVQVQVQVELFTHRCTPDYMLAIVADGM